MEMVLLTVIFKVVGDCVTTKVKALLYSLLLKWEDRGSSSVQY